MKYQVKRFKSLKIGLKELEPFIKNGEHLQTGKGFERFGGLRSRELLANWLLCVAVNSSTQPDRLSFTSNPRDRDGDGIIRDNISEETWPTEHILVPRVCDSGVVDVDALILKAIEKKQSKGAAYASGKTLVVFLNAAGGRWLPDRVAGQLPQPLNFEAVWVVGLQGVEAGEYLYFVTRLDLSRGNAPIWHVRIGKSFEDWNVVPVQ